MNRAWIILLGLSLLVPVAGGSAATPPDGTLTPADPVVTWEGTFGGLYVLAPDADVPCLLGSCDAFTLTVELGALWETADGAVEIAIRWPYDGITDLDLIVNKDGQEVARSAGVDSNAESVFLPTASDGPYEILVAPSNTLSPDGPAAVDYEGVARLIVFPEPHGVPVLPNLIALPPENFHIASAANLLPFPENPVLSCYPEETIESEDHPTRCLRYDQTIANVGDGPLELRFLIDQALSLDDEDKRLVQRIYNDDGTFDERLADSYELHLAHAHVHYRGFGQTKLWPYDPDTGLRTGDATPARVGNKVGFCVIDVVLLDDYWGGNEGAEVGGPRTWTFPTCNFPTDFDDEGVWMVQGISVGWADVYGWNLADQYIDITDLPDGVYELELIANPNGSVLEADLGDNCASTIIRIEGDVVTEIGSNETIDCSEPIPQAP